MTALKLQLIESQQNTEALREQLEAELNECTEVQATYRNKVEKFMVAARIWHIADLDYPAREQYEAFLADEVAPVCYSIYLKGFDRIKQHSMRDSIRMMQKGKILPPPYTEQILFLPYHPYTQIAQRFSNAAKKQDLVWDFTRPAPDSMKQQIYEILHYGIEQITTQKGIRLFLRSLQRFYGYCVSEQIEDIERLEPEQIQGFYNILDDAEKEKVPRIIRTCQKALFLQATEIHWYANVWYMERFHFQPERLDPARPVKYLSFLEVGHKGNRKLLKQYMQYGLGITNLAINNLRGEFLYVRNFLAWIDQSGGYDVLTSTPKQMDRFFQDLLKKHLKAASYNDQVIAIVHFFSFLLVRRYIERIPFSEDLYLKKEIPVHHDRSVEPESAAEILSKLHSFPEEIRLMYLHLWCLGLRISEVCTLKGNAYYRQGRDAWIQVYQTKMRTYKRIPIPDALYRLMQVYLKKYQIKPEDYVFQNSNGGAYRSGTFRKKMLDCCEENHIQKGEYIFKSHDYRHTVATCFYEEGVSIQGVRDYLGHMYEEMTLQYLDYMPKKIDQANEEYFSQHKSLAAGLLKKGGEKRGK